MAFLMKFIPLWYLEQEPAVRGGQVLQQVLGRGWGQVLPKHHSSEKDPSLKMCAISEHQKWAQNIG